MQSHRRSNQEVRAKAVGVATLGVATGLWAGKRIQQFAAKDRPHRMIDWDQARKVATDMNKHDTLTSVEREELNAYYGKLVDICIPIVSEYTSTSLPDNTERTYAFDRVDWINANLEGFDRMFAPIEAMELEKASNGVLGRTWKGVNQTIMSYEVGLLLGYMARRVLGQYDLALLGREQITGSGKLYYVEPNIRGIEKKLNLPKDDFRMWLALHETTHAFEFEAHSWVRVHFNSLLERYMTFMQQDAEFLKYGKQGLKIFADRFRDRQDDLESTGSWMERFMDREQRELFNEMQAMMSVIEGYSNHVMNAVGRDLLPNYDRISRKFEERQKHKTQADQIFAKLTGLDVKMEQYRVGEQFIDSVVDQKGHAFAHKVWDQPANLPTMQELRDPALWIARIDNRTFTLPDDRE